MSNLPVDAATNSQHNLSYAVDDQSNASYFLRNLAEIDFTTLNAHFDFDRETQAIWKAQQQQQATRTIQTSVAQLLPKQQQAVKPEAAVPQAVQAQRSRKRKQQPTVMPGIVVGQSSQTGTSDNSTSGLIYDPYMGTAGKLSGDYQRSTLKRKPEDTDWRKLVTVTNGQQQAAAL
jgi:hypothetical protein